jgi:hypothetical protein
MSFSRPTEYPQWTVGNPGVQVEPTSGQKFGGFVPNQRPPSTWVNWLLGNISDWINWLDQQTQLNNSQNAYDAVIGTNGTHATINALMSDTNYPSGVGFRVLVTTPQTLTSTQVINKTDFEFDFKSSAIYSKGLTTTPGISIQAQRTRLKGGRFTSWSGGSDVAIQIESGIKNCFVQNTSHNNNTTDVNDLGSNNVVSDNIAEL